jgi:hypothetical protein
MMHRSCRFALLALTLAAIPCVAQDYCGLLNQPTAVGANPPSATAEQILKVLSDTAPFNYDSIKLRDARDIALKTQGAAAQICNINQRWIFYDPDFVEQIRTKGQSDWPRYFIFAHEVAHHVNNDPQDHHRDQELQADRAAARWLTSIGASVQNLVDSINAFVVNEKREPDYPSRCDRVSGVIRAYNEEAAIINSQGGSKRLYEVGNCMPVAGGGGLYAARIIEAGAVLQAADVQKFGAPAANANLPLDFNREVAGMCPVARLREGDRLTWDNIGVCALLDRR